MKNDITQNTSRTLETVESKIRIMVIGTLPPPVGGTTVSLRNLVQTLRQRTFVDVAFIDTGGIRGAGVKALFRFFKVLALIFMSASKVDVLTLHVNLYGVALLGPFVTCVGRLWRKPVLIRRFNGRDHDILEGFKFHLVDWSVRHASLYLVQTRNNILNARKMGIEHVDWFPTSRGRISCDSLSFSRECRKLVFLSHIRPDKGIPEILAAGRKLSPPVSIDLYGPFSHGMSEAQVSSCPNVAYRGIVEPEEIIQTLQQYDALLLPTYCVGEGYPGVILEAFSVGIPVIATHWGGISELVDESCGILINPRDADSLYDAIKLICEDDTLYKQLCEGALNRQKNFDLDCWTDQFVSYCKGLTAAQQERTERARDHQS